MLQNGEFIYLLFISGFFLLSHGSSEFHPINITKSYEDAKEYCRNTYTDLATIHDLSEMNDLKALGNERGLDRAFIGLEIAETRRWHWAVPAHTLEYTNWREGSPKDKEYDLCGAIDESGKWFESNCTTKRGFVCHSSAGSPVLVTDTKTWQNAQGYCRGLSTDLVSIRSAEDNAIVANMSQNAWIGLFYDPWRWSDGSNSSFRNWANLQPNYLEEQDCGVAVFKNGEWNDLKCSGKRHFVCQGAYKEPPSTIATTTEWATKVKYMSTKYNITSKSTIVTFHFTVQNNSTHNSTTVANQTTEGTSASTPATTSISTPATTSISTSASTSASTPISNSASTSASTPISNSASTSAQPMTLAPHTSTPENLVLVQQNLTWVEAVSYCRTHHMDLVYISSEDVQRRVSEKLDLATTPHVWIGLKYICLSKTWFWIEPSGSCYQNWAPDQGSKGNHSCGVSGAIQSTGGQQWVGLPHTHRLNFICYGCTV